MARPLTGPLGTLGEALMRAVWDARRGAYARGWRRPERVGARVVSLGNLTVGGAGKTTLALHLAGRARAAGHDLAIVCRRYRPGPDGEGDEERLFRAALGAECVFAGRRKLHLARAAVAAGFRTILVDDGFSHWPLARDLDVVLVDASDPWGGGRMLPAGLLREPLRALQRAHAVVLTRVPADADVSPALESIARVAPAAVLAAGRHEPDGVVTHEGATWTARGAAHVVTATGNPAAVVASAREVGFEPVSCSSYRDHHWFTDSEVARERATAQARGATLVLTAKDAVRWRPAESTGRAEVVLRVRWRWLSGGDTIERWAIHGEEPWKRPTS